MPVLGDEGAALAGKNAHGLGLDQFAAQGITLIRVRRGGDHPALAFGNHFAGDDDNVTVVQPGGRGGKRGGEVVSGAELGKPCDGKDLEGRSRAVLDGHGSSPANSSPARTISAVVSGSVISSGIAATLTPGTSAVSVSWTSQ